MTDLDTADQLAAELVSIYSKLGKVAAVVRQDEGKARIIIPMDEWMTLTYMLYECADECAMHAEPPSRARH